MLISYTPILLYKEFVLQLISKHYTFLQHTVKDTIQTIYLITVQITSVYTDVGTYTWCIAFTLTFISYKEHEYRSNVISTDSVNKTFIL